VEINYIAPICPRTFRPLSVIGFAFVEEYRIVPDCLSGVLVLTGFGSLSTRFRRSVIQVLVHGGQGVE